MSSETLPAKAARPRTPPRPEPAPLRPAPYWLDALLLLAFLALTFLLGVFPLKDTDFWWHLKAGDTIRASGVVPRVDTYTFTAAGQPWIDLHWLFQVAISWAYQRGGVPALNLAKCAITTLAVALLVTTRKRDWPLWALIAAWLPALLVLSGRMYVRPETLTLLYLSLYLAVLPRLEKAPWLAFALPVVQAAWVNTQGLFVFGPILFAFALLDAATRPGAFGPDRARWWKLVLTAAALVGLACFLNPYGIHGALYPLQLARTMANPVFANSIAELTPITTFIQREGFTSLPFQIQIVALNLGILSFLVPTFWLVVTWFRKPAGPATLPVAAGASRKKSRAASRVKPATVVKLPRSFTLSPFRLLLFVAFSLLSVRATRNSHQFAAIVGTVTAWNFGEWVGAFRRRRELLSPGASPPRPSLAPGLITLGLVLALFAWVASGEFYRASREGRVIGLGEEPLWFPHDAVRFAGTPGMPDRFVGFHIGHASLYEYNHAPQRKVFADARLEVMGPELYERYLDLQKKLGANDPSWPRELEALGLPAVLADHENANAAVSSALLSRSDWRCVWFDPIAALFVHASYREVAENHTIDFAARHFRPEPGQAPSGTAALLASARGLRNVAGGLARNAPAKARPLVLLALDDARRYTQADPSGPDGWKLLGQLELTREPPLPEPVPRFRVPFDPVFDLSTVRATYALKQALGIAPDDFLSLLLLQLVYQNKLMNEAALPLLDRLAGLTPINPTQRRTLERVILDRDRLREALGPALPTPPWQNRDELARVVNGLLAEGKAETAALYLEKARPPAERTWAENDRIATLWLHLGEPARARKAWTGDDTPPAPGLRAARYALTWLVQGNLEQARSDYTLALATSPTLFEALYGLAVLEQDAGRAPEALEAARKAVRAAPNDLARSAAQALVAFVTPYATSPLADRAPRP